VTSVRWFIVVTLGLTLSLAACGGGSDGQANVIGANAAEGTEVIDIDFDAVADVESVDRRSDLLAELGGPDAFVVKADEIDGEVSRLESWTWYAAGSQIDLIDGEILWTTPVDDLPDGSWLPLGFSPLEFTLLAGVDETLASLADVDLQSLPNAAAELEVEGAEVWAGEQLMLVFVDDSLIYVEAFALAPGQPEEPA
jgi:hypothetical protein